MDEFRKIPTFETLPSPKGRWEISIRKMMLIVAVLGLGCWLLSLLISALEGTREAARRSQCVCNFCGIRLALYNYHTSFGELPPAYVADANGKPMHSWRVLILPFMERTDLYNRYNFSEPWDGPNNIKLLDEMPSNLACPSKSPQSRGMTSYVAITGPGTMFPGVTSAKFADVTDGLADTLMLAEVSNVEIPWTSPRDLDVCMMSFLVNDPKRPSISSPHPGGANVTFGDASTRFLPQSVSRKDLRAMTTINGHEPVLRQDVLDGK